MMLTGCGGKLPGKPNPANKPIPAEKELDFEKLYARNCAGCHGADGTHGAAPPLNDPLFRSLVSQLELTKVLQEGRKQGPINTSMAAFAHGNGGPLNDVQVQVLVYEIKGQPYRIAQERTIMALTEPPKYSTIHGAVVEAASTGDQVITPRWGKPPEPPADAPALPLWKNNGDVHNGVDVFAMACASCHGKDGEGVTKDGKVLNKIHDTAFLSLISDQEIRRIIITGRHDLGMPSYAEKTGRADNFKPLTGTEVSDLGALLAEWRNGRR